MKYIANKINEQSRYEKNTKIDRQTNDFNAQSNMTFFSSFFFFFFFFFFSFSFLNILIQSVPIVSQSLSFLYVHI